MGLEGFPKGVWRVRLWPCWALSACANPLPPMIPILMFCVLMSVW